MPREIAAITHRYLSVKTPAKAKHHATEYSKVDLSAKYKVARRTGFRTEEGHISSSSIRKASISGGRLATSMAFACGAWASGWPVSSTIALHFKETAPAVAARRPQ